MNAATAAGEARAVARERDRRTLPSGAVLHEETALLLGLVAQAEQGHPQDAYRAAGMIPRWRVWNVLRELARSGLVERRGSGEPFTTRLRVVQGFFHTPEAS